MRAPPRVEVISALSPASRRRARRTGSSSHSPARKAASSFRKKRRRRAKMAGQAETYDTEMEMVQVDGSGTAAARPGGDIRSHLRRGWRRPSAGLTPDG